MANILHRNPQSSKTRHFQEIESITRPTLVAGDIPHGWVDGLDRFSNWIGHRKPIHQSCVDLGTHIYIWDAGKPDVENAPYAGPAQAEDVASGICDGLAPPALAALYFEISNRLKPEDFIRLAQLFIVNGSSERGLDLVYDTIDDLLIAGNFNAVDTLLKKLDCAEFAQKVLLCLLTATLGAKDVLSHRANFFKRVEYHLSGSSSFSPKLLKGLD